MQQAQGIQYTFLWKNVFFYIYWASSKINNLSFISYMFIWVIWNVLINCSYFGLWFLRTQLSKYWLKSTVNQFHLTCSNTMVMKVFKQNPWMTEVHTISQVQQNSYRPKLVEVIQDDKFKFIQVVFLWLLWL